MTKDEIKQIAASAVDEKIRPLQWIARSLAIVVAALAALGFAAPDFRIEMLKRAYPPSSVYDGLKESVRGDAQLRDAIKSDIVNLISERVDSGYTRTIYFGPGAFDQPGQDILQFYAREKQKIELTLFAQGSGSAATEFVVTVDNKNIYQLSKRKNPNLGERFVALDITKFLEFPETDPFAAEARYLHTVRVRPIQLPRNSAATFELLVLVRNAKPDAT